MPTRTLRSGSTTHPRTHTGCLIFRMRLRGVCRFSG
jgi:hypothetical protein